MIQHCPGGGFVTVVVVSNRVARAKPDEPPAQRERLDLKRLDEVVRHDGCGAGQVRLPSRRMRRIAA